MARKNLNKISKNVKNGSYIVGTVFNGKPRFGTFPRFHNKIETAIAEAERLSIVHNTDAYVMQTVHRIVRPRTKLEILEIAWDRTCDQVQKIKQEIIEIHNLSKEEFLLAQLRLSELRKNAVQQHYIRININQKILKENHD